MSAKTRPCEICMKPISAERCAANPKTRLCIEHADQIKKYGGEFRIIAEQERTSKQGSLKRNYGGVNTTQVRNKDAIEKLRAEYEQVLSARKG